MQTTEIDLKMTSEKNKMGLTVIRLSRETVKVGAASWAAVLVPHYYL